MAAERHGTCEWRAAAVVVGGLILLAALVAEARAAAAECARLQIVGHWRDITHALEASFTVICPQHIGGYEHCCVRHCHAGSQVMPQAVSDQGCKEEGGAPCSCSLRCATPCCGIWGTAATSPAAPAPAPLQVRSHPLVS